MRRRALLSSLAATTAALAGCASSGDGTGTTVDDPQTTRPVTSTSAGDVPSGEPEAYASIVELETGPRTYAFAPTRQRTDDEVEVALWFDRTATADHPARLRGWLENRGDYANPVDVEWIPAVGRVHGRQPSGYDHGARLHFAPTGNNDLAETVPEVVRDESGYWRVEDLGPWMTETEPMEAGERVELEYVLVGEPGMDGRPTGTYEFRGRDGDARVAVWDTTSPGPDAASRFDGRSVPALAEDATVQWFHDAAESTEVFVQPASERVELDARVAFEVVNHSHESVGCGHWNLHKLVDGEWFHVAPMGHTSDCRQLAPGSRESWALRAFNGDAVPCEVSGGGCRDGLTRGYLGGGEYAVVAGYGHPEDQSAALVELVGDPVTITPTEDATVEVDGDTAVVVTGRYGDGERPPDASFTLTRVVDADERVIAERVMGDGGFARAGSGLRNALAAATDDVERVVVRTDEHAVDGALGYDADTRRFTFRGQAYEVTRGEPEE
ncbi:hypothetical protein LPA44_08650 [Halobacterium sp. KA-4]|uniref:hypothetical protein n=1 Tax=Halobacterium sp. KA-4 TaxID=2896367 RepID=UPI001E3598FD|nr:hypothetical protein [Halobacterium sp. KA-4]MCD2199964.1 hypothetical protein [Halobacterium sp. KA-4]